MHLTASRNSRYRFPFPEHARLISIAIPSHVAVSTQLDQLSSWSSKVNQALLELVYTRM